MKAVKLLFGNLWRWRMPLGLLGLMGLFTWSALYVAHEQQRGLLLEQAERAAQAELEIIGGFTREALARGDYSSVARFVQGYAGGHHHIHALTISDATDTYTWLEYAADPDERGHRTLGLERIIEYGPQSAVNLRMRVSLHSVDEALAQLREYFVFGGVIGVVLFTLVVWLSVEQVGLVPLRKARDELEVRVAERTEALENALQQVSEKALELEQRATHDHLTGLYNRFKFEEYMEQETERANRYGQPFSLILCDVDHFKRVNDNYGHNVGDEVLVELAQRLTRGVRKLDRVARWGGEEFVVLLPETGLDSAAELAERLRLAVEQTPFPEVGTLTMSFGVTAYREGDSRQRLLLRVDQALYQAKEGGRNQVVSQAESA